MKTILITILFFVAIFGWQYLAYEISPCDTPLTYRLDDLDPRFNLTPAQAQKAIAGASAIWDKQAAKILFQENPQAKLSINFVYDERQALTTKLNSLETNLSGDKKTLDSQIATFLDQKTQFEAKLAAFNTQVEDWNKRGGAPPDVYNQLQDQGNALRQQGTQLQNLANTLNQKTNSYNFQVNQFNSTVNQFNAAIDQKPEEGLFDGQTNTIYIYLNPSPQVLSHTLAHELGHALGVNHVNNPKGIMYPYTSSNLALTFEDRAELTKVCQAVSRWSALLQRGERWNRLREVQR